MEYRIYDEPYHNYQPPTTAQQEEWARLEREYFNNVAARKAAVTKARKNVNHAQKRARRANRK
jgi:hypothetical protein